MSKRLPTPQERAALTAYARRYGRRWKSRLLTDWVEGRDLREPDGAELRSLRNQLGPEWLERFQLPK